MSRGWLSGNPGTVALGIFERACAAEEGVTSEFSGLDLSGHRVRIKSNPRADFITMLRAGALISLPAPERSKALAPTTRALLSSVP